MATNRTNRQLPPDITRYGQVVSPSGLIVPQTYEKAAMARAIVAVGEFSLPDNGYNAGVLFNRDPNTMAVKWSLKGSGRDDRMSEAIVDGNIANVGVTPVISAQISAAVQRQVKQAMNATIDITGRETPFRKARNAIAMFDDNPLGVTAALELMVYRLNTYNRGSPISTVPIMYEFEQWDQYGMIAHPILPEGVSEGDTDRYWLEVDWGRAGTPVPFLPDPLDLEATGDKEYPFWYNAKLRDGARVWVLLHKTHIVPVIPGVSATPMIGTSPAWMCLGWLAENILIMDERAEKMLYGLADGIYMLGGAEGVDPQKDILDKLTVNRQAMWERGFKVAKPPAIIASPVDKVSIASITFRQPPGIEFKEWREYCEDVTAFCFGEPLSALVVRGGVGFGAQADAATENTMDSAIGAHLGRIATALGAIYPRVYVSVTRANDRAARLNIRTMAQYANAAVALINAGVIDNVEARVILDRDIITLPETSDLTAAANTSDEVDDGEDGGDGDGNDNQQQSDSNSSSKGASAEPEESANSPRMPRMPLMLTAEEHQRFVDFIQWGDAFQPETARSETPPHRHASSDPHEQAADYPFAKRPLWLRGAVLAEDENGVVVTDNDVDRALLAARNRVDQTLYELLTAPTVLE